MRRLFGSAAALTALGCAWLTVTPALHAQSLACPTDIAPAKKRVITAPENLRIIRTLDELLEKGPFAPDEPETEPVAEPAAAPAASAPMPLLGGSAHAYFEALANRADCYVAYTLRDQMQMLRYRMTDNRAPDVTYDYAGDPDPRRQDGAKVVVPATVNSLPNQLRLPINVTDGSVLVTWDSWMGAEYKRVNTEIGGYKHFQFSSPAGAIWYEVRSEFRDGELMGGLAGVGGRGYLGGQRTWSEGYGPGIITGVALTPQAGRFAVQPETWTRYWALFELDGPWTLVTLWTADENHDAVMIFDHMQLKVRQNILAEFWLEYNTSTVPVMPTRGPLVSYVRNVVMLRNFTDAPSIFQRPVR